MNKLSKQQEREKEDHAQTIERKKEALEEALAAFNKKVDEAKQPVEEALSDLNGAIDDASRWLEETNGEMDSYYNERSERWQEGDKGSAYSEWMNSYGSELEQVELELPEEVEMPEVSHPETLRALLDQPDA